MPLLTLLWSPSGEWVDFEAPCPHGVVCMWRDIRTDTRLTAVPDCTCP